MLDFIDKKIEEYSQEKLIEAGIVLLENEREITTLEAMCNQFCCLTECKNCPVYIHNYEKRNEHEKCTCHEPCVTNLYKWVKEQVLKAEIQDV